MKKSILRLGVNIDHLATLRQVRRTPYPDLVTFAKLAQKSGAEQITLHLREDRRHIQDDDLPAIRKAIKTMNLEMALADEMIKLAMKIKPNWVCLVPEKRQELTTEGGLDVAKQITAIAKTTYQLQQKKIKVSLFIDPDEKQLAASLAIGIDAVELHTGAYAEYFLQNKKGDKFKNELKKIKTCAILASQHGINVHAGHGLTLANVGKIAEIPQITELNIGHAIVCDALQYGWQQAIVLMRQQMTKHRKND